MNITLTREIQLFAYRFVKLLLNLRTSLSETFHAVQNRYQSSLLLHKVPISRFLLRLNLFQERDFFVFKSSNFLRNVFR